MRRSLLGRVTSGGSCQSSSAGILAIAQTINMTHLCEHPSVNLQSAAGILAIVGGSCQLAPHHHRHVA